jgi:transposase
VIADGLGRAVAFILAPGQAHELPHAVPLLDRLPGVPKWVVADRGLSSHAFRAHIWNLGARPAIPSKRNEEEVACPDWIYANRNHVERLWARLKEWRAIATRYEKTAQSFMGVLCLAAALESVHLYLGGRDQCLCKLIVRVGLSGATIRALVPRAPNVDLCPGRLATTDAQ